MTTFFSFAIADSMFTCDEELSIVKRALSPEQAKELIDSALRKQELVSAINPSHAATIVAAKERYGIEVPIPSTAPLVRLRSEQVDMDHDQLVVMSVRGLPRLGADRHEYTAEEIYAATFQFSVYSCY
jgi:hypothetical protein